MSKSIKPKNDTYLDANGVSYNRNSLQNTLDNLILNKMANSTIYTAIKDIDTSKIGFYTTNVDEDAPTNTNWYYVINIPSGQGQWLQIAVCFWFLNEGWCDSLGKIYFRTDTHTTWSYINVTII